MKVIIIEKITFISINSVPAGVVLNKIEKTFNKTYAG